VFNYSNISLLLTPLVFLSLSSISQRSYVQNGNTKMC